MFPLLLSTLSVFAIGIGSVTVWVASGCDRRRCGLQVSFLDLLIDLLYIPRSLSSGDGHLIKRRIRDGKGAVLVLQVNFLWIALFKTVDCVSITRACFLMRKDIDNDGEPLEFSSGEGLVPEGFEMCVRLMFPEEVSHVTCPPDYAYDKFSRRNNVPEGAYVEWVIELLGFQMQKDWTGMDFRAIMNDVENMKSMGNRLFKEGKFSLAKAKYDKVLCEFNHVNPQDDEEGKEFANTRNLLNLNVAACYLKMGDYRKSIETCNVFNIQCNPFWVKVI
uniref:peptidylprolyl isomerase n=1 Tax=Lactuca sativa TaxID=4236 RepID=A0A9R1VIJ2_LACSA|nr:hypothetical protein LSAT_V11C500255370 [Lactuca sativa]